MTDTAPTTTTDTTTDTTTNLTARRNRPWHLVAKAKVKVKATLWSAPGDYPDLDDDPPAAPAKPVTGLDDVAAGQAALLEAIRDLTAAVKEGNETNTAALKDIHHAIDTLDDPK